MSRLQFNLLPDIKLDYLRTRRTRNIVVIISTIAVVVSAAILLLLLFTVEIVQRKQLDDSKSSLSTANSQLNNLSNLNKIVTVQNQLYSLVGLHQQKHITSRIFSYLTEITPTQASIESLSLDLTADTLQISGEATNQAIVNTFVDTLKYTTYTIGSSSSSKAPFTAIVESDFAINQDGVGFTLTMTVDPNLFSNDLLDSNGQPQTPKLSVPTLTTTRSVLEDPTNDLFQQKSSSSGGSGQ